MSDARIAAALRGIFAADSVLIDYAASVLEDQMPQSAEAMIELLAEKIVDFGDADDDASAHVLCSRLFAALTASGVVSAADASSSSSASSSSGAEAGLVLLAQAVHLSTEIEASKANADLNAVGVFGGAAALRSSASSGGSSGSGADATAHSSQALHAVAAGHSSMRVQQAILDLEREQALRRARVDAGLERIVDGVAASSDNCWATRVVNPHCIHRARAAALAPLMRAFVGDHPLPLPSAASATGASTDPSETALAQLVAASKPRAAALAAAAARRGSSQRAATVSKSAASARGGKHNGRSKQRGGGDDDHDDDYDNDNAGGNHNDNDEEADENDDDDGDDDDDDIPFEQQVEQIVAGDDLDCEMCGRVMPLTRHHLIPKTTHARYVRLGFSRRWLLHHTVELCRACHSGVHSLFDEETLARSHHSLDKLMREEKVLRMVKYQASQRETKGLPLTAASGGASGSDKRRK